MKTVWVNADRGFISLKDKTGEPGWLHEDQVADLSYDGIRFLGNEEQCRAAVEG